MRRFLLVLSTIVLLAAGAAAADWLQFRGPGGLGHSSEKDLPVAWSGDSNIDWKTELPGPGTSSPIVVGDKIFLTCFTGYKLDKKDPGDLADLKRHLLCLDRAGGKVLWTRDFATVMPEAKMQTYLDLHGYASSTPISDGKRLYVFLGRPGVFCFDFKNEQVWQVDVGKGTHGWGSATSPLLWKNLLIVNASVETGALIALDKDTGKEIWRVKGISQSWSTPMLVDVPGGKTELVVGATKKIIGFDPDSGEELWHSDSFNWYVCPSIVSHNGVVYALQNSTCVAVKAGGKGDVTASNTLWQTKFGSVVTSPVYHDGYVYWAGDTAYCLKADDGTVVYRERLKPSPGNVYASPLVADNKLYYVTRQAGTFVVEPGPKFKLLTHNKLDPDTSVFNASPAVSNGQLLLRSDRFLYCIGKRQ